MPEPIADIVNVQINLKSVPLAGQAFGTTLVLSRDVPANPWGGSEVIRFYTSLDGVEGDFDSSTDTFKAAQAYFDMRPQPTRIAVGKSVAPAGDEAWTGTVNTATVGLVYDLRLFGLFGTYLAHYTAQNGDTTSDVATALAASMNTLLTGTQDAPLFTVGAVGAVVTTTIAIAGVHFTVNSNNQTSDLTVARTVTAAGAVEDLQAILTASHTSDWYAVLVANASGNAELKNGDTISLAPFVEGLLPKHVLFVQQDDTDAKGTNGAVATNFLFAKDFDRSPWVYTEDPTHYPNASMAAFYAVKQPGAASANLKALPGVTPDSLTETQIGNIEARNGNRYTQLISGASSQNSLIDGRCPSAQWIDNVVGCDFIANQMTIDTLNYLTAQDKVPYTDAGISAVANIIKKWLAFGVNALIFTNDPKPTITQIPASLVSASLKGQRLVDSTVLTFEATLANAINRVVITGNVSF